MDGSNPSPSSSVFFHQEASLVLLFASSLLNFGSSDRHPRPIGTTPDEAVGASVMVQSLGGPATVSTEVNACRILRAPPVLFRARRAGLSSGRQEFPHSLFGATRCFTHRLGVGPWDRRPMLAVCTMSISTSVSCPSHHRCVCCPVFAERWLAVRAIDQLQCVAPRAGRE